MNRALTQQELKEATAAFDQHMVDQRTERENYASNQETCRPRQAKNSLDATARFGACEGLSIIIDGAGSWPFTQPRLKSKTKGCSAGRLESKVTGVYVHWHAIDLYLCTAAHPHARVYLCKDLQG